MLSKTVFKRYELKYLITPQEKERILSAAEGFMHSDSYGESQIKNIYFDTDNYRLIRSSVEKPIYKEKLRIRAYGVTYPDSPVFVELKKKYSSVVYKRRIVLPEALAMKWLCGEGPPPEKTQIANEIDYFLSYYAPLKPSIFICYNREAYQANDGSDLRITFDYNILFRQSDLSLCKASYGTELLSPDTVIMEIKCSGGFPIWLTQALSQNRIYKTSFSKYGAIYQNFILPNLKEVKSNA